MILFGRFPAHTARQSLCIRQKTSPDGVIESPPDSKPKRMFYGLDTSTLAFNSTSSFTVPEKGICNFTMFALCITVLCFFSCLFPRFGSAGTFIATSCGRLACLGLTVSLAQLFVFGSFIFLATARLTPRTKTSRSIFSWIKLGNVFFGFALIAELCYDCLSHNLISIIKLCLGLRQVHPCLCLSILSSQANLSTSFWRNFQWQ